jgi:hypothetical protein
MPVNDRRVEKRPHMLTIDRTFHLVRFGAHRTAFPSLLRPDLVAPNTARAAAADLRAASISAPVRGIFALTRTQWKQSEYCANGHCSRPFCRAPVARQPFSA